MKMKWLGFALATVAFCGMAFVGCGENGEESSSSLEDSSSVVVDEGMTETEWNAAISTETLTNYTLKQTANLIYVIAEDEQPAMLQVIDLRFTEDKIALHMVQGEEIVDYVFTGAEATEQAALYNELYLALLAEYDSFTYDATKNEYTVAETVTVTVTAGGTNATVTMAEGVVSFTEEGKLLKFTCKMTESIPTENILVHGDMTWEFSDYGTTTIS